MFTNAVTCWLLKSKSNTYKQHQINYKMIQNSAFNNKIIKK